MGFRQLVCDSAQVYIPHTQKSQTGSSLPVDLYLRVGDFLPKLSCHAFYVGETPVTYIDTYIDTYIHRIGTANSPYVTLVFGARSGSPRIMLIDSSRAVIERHVITIVKSKNRMVVVDQLVFRPQGFIQGVVKGGISIKQHASPHM